MSLKLSFRGIEELMEGAAFDALRPKLQRAHEELHAGTGRGGGQTAG
jgi:hypothetical protein